MVSILNAQSAFQVFFFLMTSSARSVNILINVQLVTKMEYAKSAKPVTDSRMMVNIANHAPILPTVLNVLARKSAINVIPSLQISMMMEIA